MTTEIRTLIQTREDVDRWNEAIIMETCEHTIARWHRTGILLEDGVVKVEATDYQKVLIAKRYEAKQRNRERL